MRYCHISVAVPALAESANLPQLVESLKCQTFKDFDVYICVNNPESWSSATDDSSRMMYLDNQVSLVYLYHIAESWQQFHIIDCSSPSHCWKGKKQGVGWARKTIMDTILEEHDDNELIVSLDADTDFSEKYLESVLDSMNAHDDCDAFAVPYYHPLSGIEETDRAMLRYEIYMRHYLINMLAIKRRLSELYASKYDIHNTAFPYAFTALGSAMVFPLWAYRRVGGYTPLQGGEDFYLMQKFAKTGRLLLASDEVVRPQGRVSSRVPFGTGPAIAKGVDSMDDSYPLYTHETFEAIAETYSLFPSLYTKDIDTPMTSFLCSQLKIDDIWQPLRKNFKSLELFVHACQERVDGLRILQFLKYYREQMASKPSSEEELRCCCNNHGISIPDGFDFASSSLESINSVRDNLFNLEMSLRGSAGN